MMKLPLSENAMIVVTALAVALLAVPTYQTLVQEDALGELSALSSFSPSPVAPQGGARFPASVAQSAFKKPSTPFHNLDLKCTSKPFAATQVHGSFVQLQGKNCLSRKSAGGLEIVNKSNGYTASIFLRGDAEYQTDLIQLREGDNEILIRYLDTLGKAHEETLHILSSKI